MKINNPNYKWFKPWVPKQLEIHPDIYTNIKKCRQIIHFKGGIKRTIDNVIYVWENEMTHILVDNGTEWIINKNNVLCVEKLYYESKDL